MPAKKKTKRSSNFESLKIPALVLLFLAIPLTIWITYNNHLLSLASKSGDTSTIIDPGNDKLPHKDQVLIDNSADTFSTTAITTTYGYPWHGRAPISITITDHTNPSWRALVEKAAADWSLSPMIDVKLTASDGICDDKAKDTVCDGNYGGLASWGWTYQTKSRSGYMTDAAVYLDDFWLNSATADQRQHIICHEMGHALGLAHPICDDINGTWFTTPTQANYDALVAIYGG